MQICQSQIRFQQNASRRKTIYNDTRSYVRCSTTKTRHHNRHRNATFTTQQKKTSGRGGAARENHIPYYWPPFSLKKKHNLTRPILLDAQLWPKYKRTRKVLPDICDKITNIKKFKLLPRTFKECSQVISFHSKVSTELIYTRQIPCIPDNWTQKWTSISATELHQLFQLYNVMHSNASKLKRIFPVKAVKKLQFALVWFLQRAWKFWIRRTARSSSRAARLLATDVRRLRHIQGPKDRRTSNQQSLTLGILQKRARRSNLLPRTSEI